MQTHIERTHHNATAAAFRSKILPLRARATVRNEWLRERMHTLIPEIMQREGFDMWIVAAREYNEDPVIMTLLPEPSMSARRRTILVFSLQENPQENPDAGEAGEPVLECLTLARYGQEGYYISGWDPDAEEQFQCLARVVRERDPKSIGLNFSPTFAFGDGLSHNEYEQIATALGDTYMSRVRSAERLCVGWLERRIDSEMTVYPGIVEIGHGIIAEAFSNRVIHPGITTTEDIVWWMRQTMLDMGLEAWFQPSIEIQAPGIPVDAPPGGGSGEARTLIMPGDLLHCDMGFMYLGLATDQQQQAYVLKPGEVDAPEGLKLLLADGNRLQDILMAQMTPGRTGNEVLASTLDQAKEEGIDPSVYTHPLGYHGHAAGPTIGLWDRQDGVPGNGDYELFDNTVYSIELNAKRAVPEWNNQIVRIALEEDAILRDGTMQWLTGRQTQLHLIG